MAITNEQMQTRPDKQPSIADVAEPSMSEYNSLDAKEKAQPPANPFDPSQFPDGGRKAWLCALGGFCCLFSSFGWISCEIRRSDDKKDKTHSYRYWCLPGLLSVEPVARLFREFDRMDYLT